ncbi:MAG: 4-hydroxythreonine-4-phosphate dehydrogenase PdxA [Saprospiraceae bacterium]|nr:4-hydroxythreonine-4-phosphate dehydrogenase PdxA [Saprospiraceae bacterium]
MSNNNQNNNQNEEQDNYPQAMIDDPRPKIGISIGDLNGVGLEVILKTVVDKRILELCTPIIYGSSKVVSYHKNIVRLKEVRPFGIRNIEQYKPDAVNVVNCWFENVRINLGQITPEGGEYALLSLDEATKDLEQGKLDALVTAPINKEAMQHINFPYMGHTEFLTQRSTKKESVMLMVSRDPDIDSELRIGLVTNHVPISEVAELVTRDRVYAKIKVLEESLRMDFGINKPKIAVLGLNPHAGDNGNIGKEERTAILPAIEQAQKEEILVLGPYPADGFFGSGNYKKFDGILAMYHDQGLVAFKALSFGAGVNYTAGLSFVRTSPDHGTAYDIVGKNVASPASFRAALFTAIDISRTRKRYLEMHADPVEQIDVEKIEDNFEGGKHAHKKGGKDKAKSNNMTIPPKKDRNQDKDKSLKGKNQPPRKEQVAHKKQPKGKSSKEGVEQQQGNPNKKGQKHLPKSTHPKDGEKKQQQPKKQVSKGDQKQPQQQAKLNEEMPLENEDTRGMHKKHTEKKPSKQHSNKDNQIPKGDNISQERPQESLPKKEGIPTQDKMLPLEKDVNPNEEIPLENGDTTSVDKQYTAPKTSDWKEAKTHEEKEPVNQVLSEQPNPVIEESTTELSSLDEDRADVDQNQQEENNE